MKLIPLFLILFCLDALSADRFYCPMKCEGAKTYAKPGSCAVCGMNLEPTESSKGTGPLNTRDYRMEILLDPAEAAAGQPTVLKLFLRRTKDNSLVSDLEVVHEKKMHLILVSQDLAWFAHEHPAVAADGSFSLTTSFPSGGNYVAYADVTPSGGKNQVFPLGIAVNGAKRVSEPLKLTSRKRKLGQYEVALATEKIYSGSAQTLKFSLQHAGNAVRDLEPYLGADGHAIAISEDTTEFIHGHPPGGHHHGGASAHAHEKKPKGPNLNFSLWFPREGLYKIWVQFQHAGNVHTADFVVRVQPPKRKV